MPLGAIHDSLVLDLVRNHGCQNKGWNVRRLAALIEPEMDPEDRIEVPAMRPDAWKIDSEGRTITCFEVEVSHPLSEVQLRRYSYLWWEMDCREWQLELISVSRHGDWTPVSVHDLHYRLLALDVSRDERFIAWSA